MSQAWTQFIDGVIEHARTLTYFLPAFEVDALQEQAGSDYRYGDEMVDSMNAHCRGGRDRAVELLVSMREAQGEREALVAEALTALERLAASLDRYDGYGVSSVAAALRMATRFAR